MAIAPPAGAGPERDQQVDRLTGGDGSDEVDGQSAKRVKTTLTRPRGGHKGYRHRQTVVQKGRKGI